jgi:hypothetical protein
MIYVGTPGGLAANVSPPGGPRGVFIITIIR